MSRSAQNAGSVRPRKGLGQHFLTDPAHLSQIVAAAQLSKTDAVLEIGPGRGEMTELIAAGAGKVIAVELDDRLIPFLKALFADRPWVILTHGDILEINIGRLMADAGAVPYKVVANLPYYITGAAIRLLLETKPAPETLVLTVQAEVAERIVARPPKTNLLATSVQYYTRPQLVHRIPASAFYPVPKVDSAVVRLDRLADDAVSDISSDLFFRAVRAGYSRPRKQLRNSLSAGLATSPQQAADLLEGAGVDPNRRAETLSIEEWKLVARRIGQL
jgi:16S rRNA (adenine1518-N6/adenine1519-N6)-dimethyltransferase